ncbi:uncharacterized protein [Panulirus ornatus]|uniref:uncharacterized protein n=1 Tax=Panulirus ornatus TaxID=150431 RepID=UPI003A880293
MANTTDVANDAPDSTDLSVAMSTWTINGALDYRNTVRVSEDSVTGIHLVSYQVVLPVMVAAGLILNTLVLILLKTPRLLARPMNRYFLVLVSTDVLVLVLSIPTAISLNGCRISSYAEALYLVHVSYSIFYMAQAFTLYLILLITYDRFLGLWYFKRFKDVQTRRVFRSRMAVTVFLCVAMHLQHLFQVEIKCSSNTEEQDGECREGIWIINDCLHYLGRKTVLDNILWVLRGLVVLAVPIVLILAFNVAIIVGLVRRRLHNMASTPRSRRQAFSSIYIALAVSAAFFVCNIPISVYSAIYADKTDNCHGSFSEEIFRAVANLLMIGEHLIHFLFLSFNDSFREELQRHILSAGRRIRDALQHSTPTFCSCLGPQKKDGDVTGQDPAPPIFFISMPEVTEAGGGEDLKCPGTALQILAPSDTLRPNDLTQLRSSTSTIEEVL